MTYFVAATTNPSGAESTEVTSLIPPERRSGDLLIFVASRVPFQSVTPGWTQQAQLNGQYPLSHNYPTCLTVYTKISDGTETEVRAYDSSVPPYSVGSMVLCYRGGTGRFDAVTTNHYDDSGQTGSTFYPDQAIGSLQLMIVQLDGPGTGGQDEVIGYTGLDVERADVTVNGGQWAMMAGEGRDVTYHDITADTEPHDWLAVALGFKTGWRVGVVAGN